jgi:hypothetical protein
LDTKPFDLTQVPSIEVFQQHSQLVTLVKGIIWLREKLKQDNSPNVQERLIEGMLLKVYSAFPLRKLNIFTDSSLERVAMDPTHFSAARQSYQTSVELLLTSRASQILPGIDPQKLQAFAETFGPSAFVCRHFNCIRATQGFNSSKQRAAHEATHERRYRCTDTKCVNFSTGFAKRSDLNRHNEQYHTTANSYISLSETISRAIELPLRTKAEGIDLLGKPYTNNAAAGNFQSLLGTGQSPNIVLNNPSQETNRRQKSLESQTNYSDKATLKPPEQSMQGNQTREWHI